MRMVKEEAKKLIDQLPEEVTWDDIMYEIYVRKKIENALKAVEEGKVVPHEEVSPNGEVLDCLWKPFKSFKQLIRSDRNSCELGFDIVV